MSAATSRSPERRAQASGASDRLELADHAVDLVRRVVVAEPDADGAAGFLQAEAFHDRQRVVVPVPDEDAAAAELLGHLARRASLEADRERRCPLFPAFGAGDAVERAPGD